MIHYTLREWESLPYGEEDGAILAENADRLAAIAAASTLAGRGGGGVLEHGRRALRARGVVGVVATRDLELEILPKIEGETHEVRRHLVHMLAVALELPIADGELAGLATQTETLLELLIGLFSRRLTEVVRRGLPRRYLTETDDLPTLRGRLDATRQFTVLAASPQKLACRFDALSHDIALNQIMKAAVTRLLHVTRTEKNQRLLRELALSFADVTEVPIRFLPWDAVIIDRTNAPWKVLRNLAELLLGNRFQTTSLGESAGFSLLFEMSALFEAYIARCLARALRGSGRHVVAQGGRRFALEHDGRELFQTRPDILVKNLDRIERVIDTKWKRITPSAEDRKGGVKETDVYQMMAYGQIYGCSSLTLLYPHHGDLENPEFDRVHRVRGLHPGHQLSFATIDVRPGKDVERRLLALCRLD